jgi:hypothetical protein
MQKNQSKKLILEIAEDFNQSAEPALFQTWASMTYGTSLSDKGTQMALLRAFRQGLLSRRNGKYRISPKGEQRLAWLRSTM